MPLNTSGLFKENDIQLFQALPAPASPHSSGCPCGRLRRIYERSIFECAKLTKSIRASGEILHQLTENQPKISTQVGQQLEKLYMAPLVLALVSCAPAAPRIPILCWHNGVSTHCRTGQKEQSLPQCVQDP